MVPKPNKQLSPPFFELAHNKKTMTDLHAAKAKAAATYDAAADLFDHPANTFWDWFGRNTINKLDLKPGSLVLDVCCGSGASALPAAEQVGETGCVIGLILLINC